MVERPRFFYGWVIVGTSLVSMTLIYGIRHSFSVFFPPILDEFGWTRGSTAIMFSLNILIYGICAPVAGSLGDRWRARSVMLSGIIILGLATAGCSLAHQLWHFYLLFGILVRDLLKSGRISSASRIAFQRNLGCLEGSMQFLFSRVEV